MRPSETPTSNALVPLTDGDAPDFLDAHRVVLLAFIDERDDVSLRFKARLALVAARVARPEFRAGALDIAHHRLVAEALGVKGVPTTFVFVRGEVVDRFLGAPPDDVILESLRLRLA